MADRADAGGDRPLEAPREPSDDHWQWRLRMAQAVAERCDLAALGIRAIYLIGSTKDATAGPCSDIDLLVHYDGSERSRALIESYLRGWSHALTEWNRARTGQQVEGLVELHLITDLDIAAGTSFAAMLGSWTNRARLLRKRD
jgi:pyruvate, water dikinase